jgi:hypothetical protein
VLQFRLPSSSSSSSSSLLCLVGCAHMIHASLNTQMQQQESRKTLVESTTGWTFVACEESHAYAFLDELATGCVMIGRWRWQGRGRQKNKLEHKPVPGFAEARAVIQAVKSFFMCTTLASMLRTYWTWKGRSNYGVFFFLLGGGDKWLAQIYSNNSFCSQFL